MKKLLTFLTLLTLFFTTTWAEEITVTKTMASIASENGWQTSSGSNVYPYPSFKLDDYITVSTNSGTNNGSYWSDGWRVYESENAIVTITAATGYSLKSVTFTYTVNNNGVLKYNGTNVTSGSACSLNGNSADFTVSHSSGTKKGQVRITQISVTYESAGSTSTIGVPTISFSNFAAGNTSVTATITNGTDATSSLYRIGDSGDYIAYTEPLVFNLKNTASPIVLYAKSTDGTNFSDETFYTFTLPALGVTVNPSSYEGYSAQTVKVTPSNYVGEVLVSYTIDGGAETDYEGPFEVSDPGEHEIVVSVIDERAGSDNTATATANITILQATSIPLPFIEDFNAADGTGPNEGETWSGSTASDAFASDNQGWTYSAGYSGDGCARFGTSGTKGSATTPLISGFTAEAEYTLTFKAGAWNGDGKVLTLSSEDGTFQDEEGNAITSVTMLENAWTEYSVVFIPTGTTAKITFTTSSKRFFLDDVHVEAAEVVHYEINTVVSPSEAETAGNAIWMQGGFETINNVATSTYGTTVSFKAHTVNNWQVGGVVITNNTTQETIKPISQTNAEDGIVYSFVMPKSAVTIAATFMPYAPDLYILGNLNGGVHWDDGGIKMTHNANDNTYSIRVYASEENGYFRFYANGGVNGNPSYGAGGENLNPLEGTQPKDLWKSDNPVNFRVPAGVYDIVVGQIYDDPTTHSNPNWWGQTTITVTKVEPTLTFNPAEGEVVSGAEVTVSSNLYELLSAINSNITENDVTNMVKTDGNYAASVTITDAATVTGRAKYGYIEKTATAEYKIKDVDAEDIPFEEPFNENFGKFAYDNQDIWTIGSNNGTYFAKATGYYNSSNHAADSWLTSPLIDLRNATTPELSFEHCINKYFGTVDNEAEVYIKVNGEDWIKQTITYPSLNGNWSSFEEQVIDLTDFAGEIIQVGFRYRSTTSKAGTWEIKNFKIENVVKTYTVTCVANPSTGGQVSVDKDEYNFGETVTVTVTPNTYYDLASLTYTAEGSTTTETIDITGSAYTFTMPAANVTVTATFNFTGTVNPDEFILVTSPSDIVAGREYIIVSHDHKYVMGSIGSNDYGSMIEGSEFNDDFTKVKPASSANILTLEGSEGNWNLKQSNDYYIWLQKDGTNIYSKVSTYTNTDYSRSLIIESQDDNTIRITTLNGSTSTRRIGFYEGSKPFGHWADNNYTQPNTKYHKVYLYYRGVHQTPEMTLAQIEADDNASNVGTKYAVADPYLVAVASREVSVGDNSYVYVWCKDNKNATQISVPEGAVDFMRRGSTNAPAPQVGDWDQSNWVVLRFNAPEALALAGSKLTNVVGTYVDATNYMIDVESYTKGDTEVYTPNVYCVANFNPDYIANGGLATQANDDNTYFFMTPKVQEVCTITFAEWNGTAFQVPASSGFAGTLTLGWDYNQDASGTPVSQTTVEAYLNGKLEDAEEGETPAYKFLAVVQNNSSKGAVTGATKVYPMDLVGEGNDIPTAISSISAGNGEVKSVKYVNVAGMVSDVPFQGVNIVVTEYSDGSRSTSKMLRK